MEQSAQAAEMAFPTAEGLKKKTVRKGRKTPGAKKIKSKELPAFTRQLASMLSSGLPVVQSLVALEEQTNNANFKKVIVGVRTHIEGGDSLSESLLVFPDVFDDLYVNVMRAGESGGMLAETAARIAHYLEASAKLRRKVISAMMYPAIVTLLAVVLTLAMIIWIVPVFSDIYADFGARLPGPTQFLVNISNILRKYILFVIAGGVVLSIAFVRFKKTEHGGYILDRFKLKFPVLGELAKKVAISRFALTFAQLTRSGVPILQALEIVAYAMGNKFLAKGVMDAREVVERGENLSSALAKEPTYPRMLIHMLSAGEKTGKVDEMLTKIAEFYDDEVEAMLSGLTSLIEPLLIAMLGVMIGGIVLCMFMPIFKMHEIVAF